MKTKKMFLKRLLMLLIGVIIFSPTISFSSTSKAKANAVYMHDQPINALANGAAFVTSYDNAGSYRDIIALSFGDNIGYHSALSNEVQEVVDTEDNSYLINWRPGVHGDSLQVCGMRVAYRLLQGAGFDTNFSYFFIPGSVLLPRISNVEWATDQIGGCIFAKSGDVNTVFNIHLDIPNGSKIEYLRVFYYRPAEAEIFLPIINK